MDPLRIDPIIEFNSDTISSLRKQYDLDKPGRLEDSINILNEWLKKQDHFEKKEYSKDYLEKTIIISKGSVEKAKLKLDKTCTFRTLLPQFFNPFDVKKSQLLDCLLACLLPKMTKDHYRIFVMKPIINNYETGYMDFYKYCIMEGYGMRIKGIHFITSSKLIDTLISMFKQTINPKLGDRIQVHKNVDTLLEYISKEILPIEYGGEEQSIKLLNDKLKNVLSSEEFTDYFNELKKARTNESYRSDEKFNNQCLGMPGSFRKLAVD